MFYQDNTETWPVKLYAWFTFKLITFDDMKTIRVIDDQIRISAQNKTYKYDFEKCFVFDPTGIQPDNVGEIKPKNPLS